MAYDADCGPCTRFRYFVHRIDLKGDVGFISLIDADDTGLLDKIPEIERHTAFHVILPDGRLFTGAEAVPRLIEVLPGGRMISKMITLAPGGRRVISIVYEGFAKGHNGSSCRYPRPVAGPRLRHSSPAPIGPADPGPSRAAFLSSGVLGGLLGSLAMGLAVRIPDALCVRLATAIAGEGPSSLPLAWGFHLLTASLIGSVFGAVATVGPFRDMRTPGRVLVLGVSTGIVVWTAFFVPLMLTFLPQLVTGGLLESSLAAHILLGLALGLALAAMLRSTGPRPVPS